MFRRVASALAASAVVLSGLVWGAAPASATISDASIDPVEWQPGTTNLTTVKWTDSLTKTAFDTSKVVYVEVEWDWNVTFSAGTTAATVGGGGTEFTCPQGIKFSSPGFASPAGAPNCVFKNDGAGQQKYVVLQDLDGTNYFTYAGAQEITVTFPSGVVTAATTPKTYRWTVKSMVAIGAVSNFAYLSPYVPAPVDSEGNTPPTITIDIDPNGGTCTVDKVTGYQGTWTTAPGPRDCRRPGFNFTGFNTSADGSGTAIAIGGNLQLTGDNRIYAQYVTPRVSSAPTDVVATPGLKKVTVTWKAPSDAGTGPINGYLVQASPGSSSCVTNRASANMLECTYTNLTPGTEYTFAVQALNQAGWSNFSAASNEASPFDLLFDSLSRPEVKLLFISRGSRLEAEGRAPGLDAGATLTPVLQVGADGAFVPLTRNTTTVDRDGTFSWSRKLDRGDNGKPVSLYFTYSDAKTTTLTAKLGATIGLPSKPRDVKVTSGTNGITVSWNPPAKDGGSPVTEYEMTSDLRAASGARSKFVSCKVAAPTTTCTMTASASVFDPNKTYTFSVVAKTERGTSREATQTWKGQIYRLNIFKRARVDSEVLLSFSAVGWPKDARGFEIQAKVGQNGEWKKQGTARLDPDYVEPIGDWIGMLPRSVTPGSEVFYRVKSDKGFSNEVRFRLSSSFEYSFG